jgi:environmental stress-induced protein Ves
MELVVDKSYRLESAIRDLNLMYKSIEFYEYTQDIKDKELRDRATYQLMTLLYGVMESFSKLIDTDILNQYDVNQIKKSFKPMVLPVLVNDKEIECAFSALQLGLLDIIS